MSRFLPGTDLSKYEPDSLTGGRPRFKEEYRDEIVTKPTRDLNDDRVWSGGSRDFDERSGTYRPGFRDEGRRGGGRRGGRRGGGRRDWWNETRRSEPRRGDTDRWETLTGGNRLSSDSERMDLLTGKRSLPGDSERMRLLTGESDFGGRGSRYGGRREYDPQDRKFNRQFDTEPTDNRDVRSQFSSDIDNNDRDYIFYSNEALKNQNYVSDTELKRREMFNEPKRQKGDPTSNESKNPFPYHVFPASSWADEKGIAPKKIDSAYTNQTYDPGVTVTEKYDDSSVKERIRNLENRPQSTGGNWQEDRIKALESRGPIVNQSTVDLSGVEGRLSQLEGKGSEWQEDRIAALEGKAPSWQEDRISQLEGSRTQSKSARDLLDQRLASLENYYKNDPPPPPDESTGNRYEDKQAALNKMWEQTGNVYDPEVFNPNNPWGYTQEDSPDWLTHGGRDDRKGDYVRHKDQYGTGWQAEQSWANTLPDTYRKQMKGLDKEYNKPSHSAIIKGREYTAYGPAAGARLKMLDERNIHEDEYLGHGTWQNKFGEEITGQGKSSSDEKRYFASHSGLDPEGEEYAKRFRRQSGFESDVPGELTNYYKQFQEGKMDDYQKSWYPTSHLAKPETRGKYGWGVVDTNKSKTGQTVWDEAYYPELG